MLDLIRARVLPSSKERKDKGVDHRCKGTILVMEHRSKMNEELPAHGKEMI